MPGSVDFEHFDPHRTLLVKGIGSAPWSPSRTKSGSIPNNGLHCEKLTLKPIAVTELREITNFANELDWDYNSTAQTLSDKFS